MCFKAAAARLAVDDPTSHASATAVAGLSLGELSALVHAGALSFEDGLKARPSREWRHCDKNAPPSKSLGHMHDRVPAWQAAITGRGNSRVALLACNLSQNAEAITWRWCAPRWSRSAARARPCRRSTVSQIGRM